VVGQPEVLAAAIEETLRFDTPVPVWRRATTRPVTLGGVRSPAGARLFLWLAAAGLDPAVFDVPGQFDPEPAECRSARDVGDVAEDGGRDDRAAGPEDLGQRGS
jgi:cytochrome P450